jgi:hypothetical protein
MKEGTNYVARIQEEKGKKGDYFWYLAIVDYAIGRSLFWSEKASFVACPAKSSYQILVANRILARTTTTIQRTVKPQTLVRNK